MSPMEKLKFGHDDMEPMDIGELDRAPEPVEKEPPRRMGSVTARFLRTAIPPSHHLDSNPMKLEPPPVLGEC